MSPAAAASATLAAAWPPFSVSTAPAAATMSWPAMRCCAFSKLAAIGMPILPSPIKPIVAMPASSPSIERQLGIAERCEIACDDRVGDFGKGCRVPMRRLVLVDQRRPHALVEIAPGHEMLGQ